jgi:asparagine synthase (glutamine-hydrolysing)
VIALDGTIDNRDELSRSLADDLDREHRDNSLHILLAGYRRWGLDLPRYLIGEFALLLWDEKEQVLLAARDPFGVRSLFYTVTDQGIFLASQLRQLLDPAQLSLEALDEEYIADFLVSRSPCGVRTAFDQIKRLRASHALLVSNEHVRTFPYWDLDDRDGKATLKESDYIEEFRHVFRQAVSLHLQTPGKVWAELSGGLDSSSIVSMAQTILTERGRPSSDLETVTFTWPESPQSDEREWAEEVLSKFRVKGHFLHGDGQFFSGAVEEARYRDDPHFGLLCSPLLKSEADLLKAAGVNALLSGARAESVVLQEDQEPFHLADLLKEFRIRGFLDATYRWQRYLRAPLSSILVAYVWRPLLDPRHVPRAWDNPAKIDPWIANEFRRRTDLSSRVSRTSGQRRFKRPSDQFQYELLRATEQSADLGYLGWSVEVRFPFLYRPLVELAFAIPWDVKIAPQRDKRLLREGMAGVLPERIRERRGWKSPTYAAFRTLARTWPAIAPLGEASHLVNLGVFDQDRWEAALHRARHGASGSFVALTSSMALEYWLRSFFGEPPRLDRRSRRPG